MKKYNVMINGNQYEVEIEEVGSGSTTPVSTTAPAPVSSAPVAQPVATPTPPPQVAGGEEINAPMPGTVLSVDVSVGQEVKVGQLLLVLEAMKMENEIVSPRDGKVVAVSTSKGTSVNTGDALITLA